MDASPFSSRLHTGYFATPTETLQIKSILQHEKAIIDGLGERIEEARKTLQALERRRQEQQALVDRHSASIPPINTLPADILEAIFLKLHSDSKATSAGALHGTLPIPVVLSHVCRNWRTLVLATPALWSYIEIKPFPYETTLDTLMDINIYDSTIALAEQLTPRALAIYEDDLKRWAQKIERQKVIVDVCLERSCQHPLDLFIYYAHQQTKEGIAAQARQVLMSFFLHAFTTSQRWRSATLDIDLPDLPDLLKFFEYPSTSFPILERLTIRFNTIPGGMTLGIVGAPSLHTLSISSGDGMDPFAAGVNWSTIVHLNIMSATAQHLIEILGACPSLTRLSLFTLKDGFWSFQLPTRPVHHGQLRALRLTQGPWDHQLPLYLSLPSLYELSFISSIHEPGATEDEDTSPIVGWIKHYGDQLTALTVPLSSLTPSALDNALEHIPHVRRLRLGSPNEDHQFAAMEGLKASPRMWDAAGTRISPEVFERLTPRRREDGEWGQCCCPELEFFACELEELDEDCMAAILNLVIARRSGEGAFTAFKELNVWTAIRPEVDLRTELEKQNLDMEGLNVQVFHGAQGYDGYHWKALSF